MSRESFLVRIWWDDTCNPSDLRGEVEHVRTGQARRFCGEEELFTILRAWLHARASIFPPQDERNSSAHSPSEDRVEEAAWKP